MKNIVKKIGVWLVLGMLGYGLVYGQVPSQPSWPLSDLPDLLDKIATALLWILLLVAIIMIVAGGLNLATAAGDETKVTSGRRMIMWAIVAVIIAFLAKAIINFISDQLR